MAANSKNIIKDCDDMLLSESLMTNTEKVSLWAATELKALWISHPHADHHLGLV
jgi:metal-dependent hydrolase (beta-lactamase superfamily II)